MKNDQSCVYHFFVFGNFVNAVVDDKLLYACMVPNNGVPLKLGGIGCLITASSSHCKSSSGGPKCCPGLECHYYDANHCKAKCRGTIEKE